SLVLIVTGILYWALVNGLTYEDDQILLDKVHVLRSLLTVPHPDEREITQEIGEDANAPRRVYIRVVSVDGRVLYESPGMAAELPPRLFPTPPAHGEQGGRGITVRSLAGRSFQVLSSRLAYGGDGTPHDVVVQAATDVTAD